MLGNLNFILYWKDVDSYAEFDCPSTRWWDIWRFHYTEGGEDLVHYAQQTLMEAT